MHRSIIFALSLASLASMGCKKKEKKPAAGEPMIAEGAQRLASPSPSPTATAAAPADAAGLDR